MDLMLRDRAALVTAASSGLGLAAACALAAQGCRVAIVARREAELLHAADAVARAGAPAVHAVAADIDDPVARTRAWHEAVARLGRLDAVVANTGNPPGGWVDAAGDADWDDAFAKLRAVVEINRLAAAHMAGAPDGRGGAVVNVLSRTALEPDRDLALSSIVRAGLLSWAKMLAREAGPAGVRVVSVLPGLTRTQGIERGLRERAGDAEAGDAGADALAAAEARRQDVPLGRLGTTDAFGRLVAFLASPACDYVSGSAVRFDGGAIRHP